MDRHQILDNAKKIFEQGSVTYFNSAQFFPPDVRDDVMILYSFVRTADDFVDCNPQKPQEFFAFKEAFHSALSGIQTNNLVIDSFAELIKKKNIEPAVSLRFLNSMEQDLTTTSYQTIEQLEEYMTGSAETVGFMMAKILNLPKQSQPYALLLGKSMQFINFIRDIDYDATSLQRCYIPLEIIQKYNLSGLKEIDTKNNPKKFTELIRDLIELYYEWQMHAETGFRFIPKEYLIPIKTASDMYKWTANKIYTDPYIIYQERLKPDPQFVMETAQKIKQQL